MAALWLNSVLRMILVYSEKVPKFCKRKIEEEKEMKSMTNSAIILEFIDADAILQNSDIDVSILMKGK